MKPVLVVDDEQQILIAIEETLNRKGFHVTTASSGIDAIGKLESDHYAAVLTDVRMPGMTGMDVLKRVKRVSPATPVIFLTGHGTVEDAVSALKQGVFDYLMKPFSAGQLTDVLGKATARTNDLNGQETASAIVTRDPKMKQLILMASQAALSDATVLVQAESGTGKELFARHIHACSDRSGKPFVALNCAAVPDELLESELFGHEKGAFTGAQAKKPGKFELANGGTLLLDEIGEMDLRLQAKLLRVLQEKEIDRVGGTSPVPVDVRVIATTNQNLRELVSQNRFREDLYYRLNVIPLSIPPLRRRKADIPILISHFCDRLSNGDEKQFAEETLELLSKYDWPGNVRELENITRRALALCRNPVVSPGDLFLQLDEKDESQNVRMKAGLSIREMERKLIEVTLKDTGGNRTHAAQLLGISLRTLRNKLKEYREVDEDWEMER